MRWLRLAAARVADAREHLTDLDAAIGDGDHGINLDRGFAELVRRLDTGACPVDPPPLVLEFGGPGPDQHGRRRQRRPLRAGLPARRGGARGGAWGRAPVER